MLYDSSLFKNLFFLLTALEYTLSHIFLEDRRVKPYEEIEEESQVVADSAIKI